MIPGNFQSSAILKYKDEQNEGDNMDQRKSNYHHHHKLKSIENNFHNHPTFPGNGQLFLGQEQEKPCGGFDDTDSLSADISKFEASYQMNQITSE